MEENPWLMLSRWPWCRARGEKTGSGLLSLDDFTLLTRLATLSGVSRGCKNSAVMSVSDWPEIWAEAFDVPDGPGSKSLSSSSSPKLGSEREGNKRLAPGLQQDLCSGSQMVYR